MYIEYYSLDRCRIAVESIAECLYRVYRSFRRVLGRKFAVERHIERRMKILDRSSCDVRREILRKLSGT